MVEDRVCSLYYFNHAVMAHSVGAARVPGGQAQVPLLHLLAAADDFHKQFQKPSLWPPASVAVRKPRCVLVVVKVDCCSPVTEQALKLCSAVPRHDDVAKGSFEQVVAAAVLCQLGADLAFHGVGGLTLWTFGFFGELKGNLSPSLFVVQLGKCDGTDYGHECCLVGGFVEKKTEGGSRKRWRASSLEVWLLELGLEVKSGKLEHPAFKQQPIM